MQYNRKKLRHELKFYIDMQEYWLLRSRARAIMQLDSFHLEDDSYNIRSLYFDDMYDSSLYEKNAGIYQRKKFRIRIYNLKDDVIKLECKQKYGEYTSKESSTLTLDEYRSIMAGDYGFLRHSKGVRQEFFQELAHKAMRPRVIVDYDREAYVYDTSEVRITFDKNLRVGYNSNDIFDGNLITYGVLEPGRMILEVKFNEFMPGFVSGLLASCAVQIRSSISKYVICRVSKGNIF